MALESRFIDQNSFAGDDKPVTAFGLTRKQNNCSSAPPRLRGGLFERMTLGGLEMTRMIVAAVMGLWTLVAVGASDPRMSISQLYASSSTWKRMDWNDAEQSQV